MQKQVRTYKQSARTDSPRSLHERCLLMCWEIVWTICCAWTPKPLNAWRLAWLRMFGAKIYGSPFIHQRARIAIPWNVIVHAGACVGDRASIYSLAPIELGEGSVIAQECYLCAGTHDFSSLEIPLQVAPITVGRNVFLGARTFVLPGINIAEGAVTGACSVVTNDLPAWTICAGNPCRPLRARQLHNRNGDNDGH